MEFENQPQNIMSQTPNSIAFEVELGVENVCKTPESVQKKLQKAAEAVTSRKRELSKENIVAKLAVAQERKLKADTDRQQKAHNVYVHAKNVAKEQKEQVEAARDEFVARLQDKLDQAASLKAEQQTERLKKIEQHIASVVQRKDVASQECMSPGQKDIVEKLAAAEERRKAFEDDKVSKIQFHLKQVEERKHSDANKITQADIERKLLAAHERRMYLEQQQQEKLQAYEEHASKVRSRRESLAKSLPPPAYATAADEAGNNPFVDAKEEL